MTRSNRISCTFGYMHYFYSHIFCPFSFLISPLQPLACPPETAWLLVCEPPTLRILVFSAVVSSLPWLTWRISQRMEWMIRSCACLFLSVCLHLDALPNLLPSLLPSHQRKTHIMFHSAILHQTSQFLFQSTRNDVWNAALSWTTNSQIENQIVN